MKYIKPILYVLGFGIIGVSLYNYYQKQLKFIQNIQYKIIGLKIINFTKSNIVLDITLSIYNASNIEATVTEMYLDCFMNNVKVGNINEIKDINILAKQTSTLTYRFSFDPSIVLKNIVDLISFTIQSKDVTFDVIGHINLKSAFIKTTIPFEYHSNLKTILNIK